MVGKAPSRMPARVPGELGPVIVVVGPQRPDHGNIVRAFADVPPPVSHEQAALAVALIAGVEPHEHPAIAVGRVAVDDVLPLRSHHVAIGCVANGPAGKAIEFGLDVEALNVADAAAQEDPDDRLRFRREVRSAVGAWVDRRGPGDTIAEEHGAQGQSGEPHAGIGQEGATGDAGAIGPAGG